jgi:cystathionine beta-lyase/cystathionine gamma-synthase
MTGYSSLFGFELDTEDFEAMKRAINALRFFHRGVSWGGVESLVITPRRADNADRLREQGLPPGLIRLSVGLEPIADLIEDLDRALAML